MRRFAWLIIAAAACRAPQAQGPRLREQVAVGAGAASFHAMIDTAFSDAPCLYAAARDRQYRCLPQAPRAERRYTDASCFDEVALTICNGAPAEHVRIEEDDGRVGVYAATPVSAPPALYRSTDKGCTLDGAFAGDEAVAQIEEVAPSRFVAGKNEDIPYAPKLMRNVDRGQDGSLYAHGFSDPSAAPVNAYVVGRGSGQRVIWGGVVLTQALHQFADAACTEPVLTFAGSAEGVLFALVEALPESCDTKVPKIVALAGALPKSAPLYSVTSRGCTPSQAPPLFGKSFRTEPAKALMTGTLERAEGDRLVLPFIQNDDGSRADLSATLFGAALLFDQTLASYCRFAETRAGLRCLPQDTQLLRYFKDTACSEPVIATSQFAQKCSAPIIAEDALASPHRYYRSGAALGRIPLYRRTVAVSAGACMERRYPEIHALAAMDCVADFEGEALALGAEYALEDFASGALVLR